MPLTDHRQGVCSRVRSCEALAVSSVQETEQWHFTWGGESASPNRHLGDTPKHPSAPSSSRSSLLLRRDQKPTSPLEEMGPTPGLRNGETGPDGRLATDPGPATELQAQRSASGPQSVFLASAS
ncbi:unnamed protein product [Rangifer tarandus platyrhynchus]|uniref:Uncharacterized protein n=2 Tax=Rangifer tarandus platyrhynchus TaxID=3082113 RepID=A0ACB0F8T9_RANTA|nr:unnamed protein product [Rangifer tarandus platyrhynchus]CAI9708719.1 unnamed protein product [Rangifer tarandus platyrhynchus]